MKKSIILPLLVVGMAAAAQKQTSEKPLVTVYYGSLQVIDTTQRNAPYPDDMVLVIGNRSSIFTSLKIMQLEARVAEVMKKKPAMQNNGLNLNYGVPFMFYRDPTDKVLISRALFRGNNYVIKESLPVQDWKITAETKIVQGYNCQKATTSFRGRSWEAWFCAALPYRNGPWKLGGLPGLILEACDVKKEVIFSFRSLEKGNSENMAIALPEPMIPTTAKELKKAADAVLLDLAGKQSNGVMSNNASPGATVVRRAYNNPIEKVADN